MSDLVTNSRTLASGLYSYCSYSHFNQSSDLGGKGRKEEEEEEARHVFCSKDAFRAQCLPL